MGTTYRFQCPSCKYEAKVSGGPDQGMMCRTETIVCNDCKSLLDVTLPDIDEDSYDDSYIVNTSRHDIDIELIKDDASAKEYIRLFIDRKIAAFKVDKDVELSIEDLFLEDDLSFESELPKKGFCPYCDNKSASASTGTEAESRVWGDLCPQCQDKASQEFHSEGLRHFYSIKEAKKRGLELKSNHCPICGQKIDEDDENNIWSTRDGTYPCSECLRSEEWEFARARSSIVCRLCGSSNLTLWPLNGQIGCPKCGGEMLCKGLGELWD